MAHVLNKTAQLFIEKINNIFMKNGGGAGQI